MKQFELETIIFGFGPETKTNPKNIENYRININGKNKDNNRHKAINFNALIVGYKDEDMIKIHHRHLSIKKECTYHLKENFYKNKGTTPEPIVIFYKKNNGITSLQKKLIDDLYIDLNHIYSEHMNNLENLINKESLHQYEIDYQTKIEHLAIKLFSSIEKASNPSIIEGVILNKFYIGHSQGRFFIQDTDKSFLNEKVSLNKYDSFLTKKLLSAPPIPSNLITETSGLIFDYNNILRSKYDQKTTTAAKDRIENEMNLVTSLSNALFSRNNKELQSTLQAFKKHNEEKHSKFKHKLLSKFYFKPKRVRLIENVEALTRQHSLSL